LKKVAIITSFPRAQRVSVYNEMCKNTEYEFCVFYLRSMPHGRHWEYGPELTHNHKLIHELRIWKHLYLSPGLLKELVDYEPDMMIMTQYASPGMQLIMYYCSIKKIPWVFWSEAPNVRYETPFVKNEALRTLLRKTAMLPIKYFSKEIWGIGNRAINEYIAEFGNKKIYKNLPYYSNLDLFFDASKKRNKLSVPTFLFSGSLTYRKGADIFSDAIKTLSKKKYKFNVIVMGVGKYEVKFKELSKYKNISIQVLGFVQLNNIPDIYSKANVLVFPSRHDGWGMTLPEGMAAEMAVISTPYTGCAVDTIVDKKNGLLIDVNHSMELERAMEFLINNPEEISQLGGEAKKTISNYTHMVGSRKFNSMISSFLNQYT
jgi:glycosyltransferase involved in cell wall biosynthesis